MIAKTEKSVEVGLSVVDVLTAEGAKHIQFLYRAPFSAALKNIHEDYDTSAASGRLKINIMLSVLQDEADRTHRTDQGSFRLKEG